MIIPGAAGAARLLWTMTRGALRQTKHLSPYKLIKGKKTAIRKKTMLKGPKKGQVISRKVSTQKHELRPWLKKFAGGSKKNESILGKFGVSKKKRGMVIDRYAATHGHLRKHKKLYGSGLGGAAVWDILDRDD